MTTVRWGVLGTARIAEQQVIPAIQKAAHAQLTAVASRSLTKAQEFAARNNIVKAYGSYEELLDDPEIDAVYIPLPNHLHAQWTIAAARRKKHVLCEKPATLNAEELQSVLSACQEEGVVFMEAFMYQFHPQWNRVREVLQSGELGEVKVLAASFSFPLSDESDIRLSPDKGGGSLYDVGCYCVHAIQTVSGKQEPVDIGAVAKFAQDNIVDRSLSAALRFQNGLLAHFDCSFEAADRQSFHIAGSMGTITLSLPFRPDKGNPEFALVTNQGTRVETFEPFDFYRRQVEHFCDCVASGNIPFNTPEDSMTNARIVDAVYRAAGRTV
ncbi:Gfo/Idh/MocA family oxidoreductase [Alicyclobacillus tolerans]|uniref:Gfo/Idh/MocA family protein n=1 Tax=Alicyclobacillus tolerans TaxID=90970 RepID=UPI001F2578E3|nr:Gfo/Idh/MocA family oxidoreductase [Alicyclobacillus tolerans]MCF8567115.1 Gfo/Idh/MocA family oxidoreductase [Alicyclobacillus tolerans]